MYGNDPTSGLLPYGALLANSGVARLPLELGEYAAGLCVREAAGRGDTDAEGATDEGTMCSGVCRRASVCGRGSV